MSAGRLGGGIGAGGAVVVGGVGAGSAPSLHLGVLVLLAEVLDAVLQLLDVDLRTKRCVIRGRSTRVAVVTFGLVYNFNILTQMSRISRSVAPNSVYQAGPLGSGNFSLRAVRYMQAHATVSGW